MVLLAMLPLETAHQIVLPILWFLQVNRISDITSKETTNNIHYFAYTSFKPIRRLLVSQLLAAVLLIQLLAFPLVLRLGLALDVTGVIAIVVGGILLVMVAALLGSLSKGKKLFEVLFFMVTYANINGIPFVDYFGGCNQDYYYLIQLAVLVVLIGGAGF